MDKCTRCGRDRSDVNATSGLCHPCAVENNIKHALANGGTAFPSEGFGGGMSLRDWFAGMAVIGLAASDERKPEFHDEPVWARNAYTLADAMLAAREVPNV